MTISELFLLLAAELFWRLSMSGKKPVPGFSVEARFGK